MRIFLLVGIHKTETESCIRHVEYQLGVWELVAVGWKKPFGVFSIYTPITWLNSVQTVTLTSTISNSKEIPKFKDQR